MELILIISNLTLSDRINEGENQFIVVCFVNRGVFKSSRYSNLGTVLYRYIYRLNHKSLKSLKKILFLLLSAALISVSLGVHVVDIPQEAVLKEKAPFNAIATPWADSIFRTMSLEEKIGQLFSVAAYSNKD